MFIVMRTKADVYAKEEPSRGLAGLLIGSVSSSVVCILLVMEGLRPDRSLLQMSFKPSAGKPSDLFQLAALLEKMCCAGDYLNFFVSHFQSIEGFLIQPNNEMIISTHYQ